MGSFLRYFNVVCSFAAGGLASCALSMFWYFRFGDSPAGAAGVSLLMLYPGFAAATWITNRLGWLPLQTTPMRASLAIFPICFVLPSALPPLVWLAHSKSGFLQDPLHLAALAAALAGPAVLLAVAVFIFSGRWRTPTLHALFAAGAAALVTTMMWQLGNPAPDLQTFALTLLPATCALLSGATGYGLLRSQA